MEDLFQALLKLAGNFLIPSMTQATQLIIRAQASRKLMNAVLIFQSVVKTQDLTQSLGLNLQWDLSFLWEITFPCLATHAS